MHQEATVMIVPAEVLGKTPQAFQDYVAKFFERTVLCGQKCYWAFRTLSLNSRHLFTEERGVAPRHSAEVDCFTEGLPEGVTLSEWIRENAPRCSVKEFSRSWEAGGPANWAW